MKYKSKTLKQKLKRPNRHKHLNYKKGLKTAINNNPFNIHYTLLKEDSRYLKLYCLSLVFGILSIIPILYFAILLLLLFFYSFLHGLLLRTIISFTLNRLSLGVLELPISNNVRLDHFTSNLNSTNGYIFIALLSFAIIGIFLNSYLNKEMVNIVHKKQRENIR